MRGGCTKTVVGACALAALLSGCNAVFEYMPDYRWGCGCKAADDNDRMHAERLKTHVTHLAAEIGPRSYRNPRQLEAAADYIQNELGQIGGRAVLPTPVSYRPDRWLGSIKHRADDGHCADHWDRAAHDNAVCDPTNDPASCPQSELITRLSQEGIASKEGVFKNIELRLPGRMPSAGVVVVGAHYDSDTCESHGCNPGADDNASGVAALIELARTLSQTTLDREVRFVAFTNEEEPFFWTEAMGSRAYARQARAEQVDITAMLSIETIGYYRDEQDSQATVPLLNWFYDISNTGNFIAFVGDRSSSALVHQALDVFRNAQCFPAEGIAASSWLPGIGWSDHWSFWQEGYRAIMVTDTAPNRNHCYHRGCDVPERLDYPRMARVVTGLESVITALATISP